MKYMSVIFIQPLFRDGDDGQILEGKKLQLLEAGASATANDSSAILNSRSIISRMNVLFVCREKRMYSTGECIYDSTALNSHF